MKDQTVLGQQYGLAPFDPATRAIRRHAWEHERLTSELETMGPLVQSIAELKEQVTGLQLIVVFVKRCVQLLQCRERPMWQYTGVGDSTRCLHENFSSVELVSRVQ